MATSHLDTVMQPRPETSCVLNVDVRGAVDIIRVEVRDTVVRLTFLDSVRTNWYTLCVFFLPRS